MKGEPEQIFSFAEFELDPARRRLVRDGEPLNLHAKAFDLLLFLVRNAGRVVSREEILETVWDGQFIEESNLTVQISALRKILQDPKNAPRFLTTVPGKGYKFIADVQTNEEIIVERHRVARIVVEEREHKEGEKGRRGERATSHKTSKISSPFLLFSSSKLFVILLLASLAGAAVVIYRWNGRNSEAVARQLSTHIFNPEGGTPWRVAISRDGKWVAYVQRTRRLYSLYLGELETNRNLQIIAPLDRFYEFLTFAPDGKHLYFTARDDNHPRWTLMRVPVYGGAVRELAADVHSGITFSPDGRRIAFLREHETEDKNSLVTADAETGSGEKLILTREGAERFAVYAVAWSPDGKSIVAGTGKKQGGMYELSKIDVETGRLEKIGERDWSPQLNLAWLSDGSGLLLISETEGGNFESLQTWLVAYPSGDARKITTESVRYSHYSLSASDDNKLALLSMRSDPQIWQTVGGDYSKPRKILEGSRKRQEGKNGLAVASDGRIFYTARTGAETNIWEMSANGENHRQITPTQADAEDRQVSVTPDNRYLVFVSDRSGKGEIWRANTDGSNLTQLTTDGGNVQPTLSPDGKWVVYTRMRGGRRTLWRVPVEGGEPYQLTTDETSWAAVSPDGRLIAGAYGKFRDAFDQRIAVYPFEGGAALKVFPGVRPALLENRLRWSPDGSAIIYKDRIHGLWRQDLNSEKAVLIDGLDEVKFYHFAFFPGSQNLIYSGGTEIREIVIVENFR